MQSGSQAKSVAASSGQPTTPAEILSALKELHQSQTSPTRKYFSHYPLERKHERLIKAFETVDAGKEAHLVTEFARLNAAIKDELSKHKKSNEQSIKLIDFVETCIALINAGDQTNFDGLVDIGEYFGAWIKGRKIEVSAALYFVLERFERNASQRTPSNKACLDLLCKILNEPSLPLPKAVSATFGLPTSQVSNRQKIAVILQADAIDALMVWLLSANPEDRNFALRAACYKEGATQCLLFLLKRTAPSKTDAKINLLAAGQPSGQIAMHRAIQSGKPYLVSILMNEETNPSNDLLKQLLVPEQQGSTPIDLIQFIQEAHAQRQIANIVKTALGKYRNVARFGLSAEDAESIQKRLDAVFSSLQQSTQFRM